MPSFSRTKHVEAKERRQPLDRLQVSFYASDMKTRIYDWRSALRPDEAAEVAKADSLTSHYGKLYSDAVAIREAIRKRATRRLRYQAQQPGANA